MPPADGRAGGAAGPALAALQGQFFGLITAPEGVAAGLAAAGLRDADLDRVIASDQRASAVERLDIYANMYFYRIRDTLRDYFPATAAALGEAGFHNLITDYLLAHPSRHPSLREVGRHLPGFAARHALAAGGRPWLGELAALEWARLDVFDRADEPALDRARLQALAPEEFASLPLRAIRAHELVPSVHAVDDLWSAVNGGGAESSLAPPAERETPAAFVVWRRETTVYHRLADAAEAEAIAWLQGGLGFGALCERLGQERSPELAAQRASAWLGQWLADGLLLSVGAE